MRVLALLGCLLALLGAGRVSANSATCTRPNFGGAGRPNLTPRIQWAGMGQRRTPMARPAETPSPPPPPHPAPVAELARGPLAGRSLLARKFSLGSKPGRRSTDNKCGPWKIGTATGEGLGGGRVGCWLLCAGTRGKGEVADAQ